MKFSENPNVPLNKKFNITRHSLTITQFSKFTQVRERLEFHLLVFSLVFFITAIQMNAFRGESMPS